MGALKQALRYARIELEDLAELAALYQAYLNGGEASTAHLVRALGEPGYIGVKCLDDDKTAGVFSALPGICFTCPQPALESRIRAEWGDTRLYSGDILVVLPPYRGRHIAGRMARELLVLLREAGVETLLVEMWDPLCRGTRPAEGIMKELGQFLAVWDFPDFYRDLYAQGMTCPCCGAGPCRCGARVGVLALFPGPQGEGVDL